MRKRTRASGRSVALLAAIIVLVVLASVGVLHERIISFIQAAQPFATRHEVMAAVVFVGLAALSSILILVSSVFLIPLGVAVWGKLTCIVLLWIGWFLGGLLAYSIARRFGRPAVRRLLSREKIRRYERRVPKDAPFTSALLVQLTVPSDIGGYFFGLLAYPRPKYLGALAIAEVPYALGTVYLSSAFVERNTAVLIIAAVGALALAIWEWRRVSRKAKPAAK